MPTKQVTPRKNLVAEKTANLKEHIISIEELSKNNTSKSAWVAVDGKVYDVTNWISKHPGGSDVILMAAGRDATQLFETYHWNTEKARKILSKYEIGTLGENELPVFPARGEFFQTLKKRLANYFDDTKQDPFFHPAMAFGYGVVLALVATSYYLQFFSPAIMNSWLYSTLCAIALGFGCAQVGLLPLHDASHFAATRSPWAWKILGSLHDFINGASYLSWCYQHVLGHHLYTNIADADPDIMTNNPDIRRIKPSQPWYESYINQEKFVPLLYGLLGVKVRVQDINIIFLRKLNDHIRVNPPTLWHFSIFWMGKAFFVFYRFLLPLFVLNQSVMRVLYLFVVSDLVSSYWLALTFQANHVVDDVEWPLPNEKNEVSMDWAEMQVVTAQDYAHDSMFWTKLAGSLNYQIVHHLFPNIAQHYYPEIAPIVIKTCEEFGIRYRLKNTYREAFQGHIKHLEVLGKGKQ